MVVFVRVAAILAVLLALSDFTVAQSRRSADDPQPSSLTSAEEKIRERLNAWTIGLAGGLLEGAPIRFATEMAPTTAVRCRSSRSSPAGRRKT